MNEVLDEQTEQQIEASLDTASLPPRKRPRRSAEVADHEDDARAANRRMALEPGATRDHLYTNHPVTKNEVRVATPPLQEAYNVIQDVIVHRDPGTCLLAHFRVGKTTAIEACVAQLNKTFPELPVGIAFAKDHTKFTDGTFFSDLLQDYGHAGALRGTTADRRLRWFNMVMSICHQKRSDRYLLLVDEGQNWREPQWTWLRDIANDLHKKQIRLITVTFGQTTDMQELRQRLLSRNRTDLIGRFLLTPREFRGIRDRDELHATLDAYDDPQQSEYPAGTGISFSEFFMPVAYGSGWRLSMETDAMWNEFCTVAARSNQVATNIGMNWIGGAIRNFLFSSTAHDAAHFRGSPEQWVLHVQASGFESTLF